MFNLLGALGVTLVVCFV